MRVKCTYVNVEAQGGGYRAHGITTRISLAARFRVHKIVRVSHNDIIISDTKNGINIVRTEAGVILSHVTRDKCTCPFYHVTRLPLLFYLVTSSG